MTQLSLPAQPYSGDLLRALREETREIHTLLENSLVIGRRDVTLDQFRAYLHVFLDWLQPIEIELWSSWPLDIQPELRSVKVNWILSDLGQCETQTSHNKTVFDEFAEKVGICYVIEGSMLGGRVLRKSGPIFMSDSVYLNGYGRNTSAMWKSFIAISDQLVREPQNIAIAASAARRAFEDLRERFITAGLALNDIDTDRPNQLR